MRLVSVEHQGRAVAGISLAAGVLELSSAARLAGERAELGSVLDIIRGGAASYERVMRLAQRASQLEAALLPHSVVKLLAPMPRLPRNVFCVGRNYVDHVKEGYEVRGGEVKLPEVPQFFTKATQTVNAPQGDVRLDPRVTRRFDYEVELVVVLGRGGRDIAAERAFEHVFGYCVGNDFTARDLQKRHDQWFKGKSLDTTFPFGPCIVDRAEVGDPTTLELTLSVNGEERQRAHVAQMIFDIPSIIASLSAGLTLEAGDLISTGTPSGVGFAMSPPQFLRGGDLVVAAIDRIGKLENRIVEVEA